MSSAIKCGFCFFKGDDPYKIWQLFLTCHYFTPIIHRWI